MVLDQPALKPKLRAQVRDAIPAEAREALLPLAQLADGMSACIKDYDRGLKSRPAKSMGTRSYYAR
jgi:hypothetical protein